MTVATQISRDDAAVQGSKSVQMTQTSVSPAAAVRTVSMIVLCISFINDLLSASRWQELQNTNAASHLEILRSTYVHIRVGTS